MKIENIKDLKDIILSILFVSGDGLDKEFILSHLEVTPKQLDNVIDELCKEYSGSNGIHVIKYKNKVQLASNPLYADYISEVLNPVREKALTRASLETLAIIAYKQPITKLEIEDIRGVNADYAIQLLLEQNMIEIVGRKDSVGKPLLFGTNENFLKRFNLKDLGELPDYEELLERIKVINTATEEESSDSLYNEFELQTEELPDFLKDEDGLKKITGDD